MAIVYDENKYPVLEDDYDYEALATGGHEAQVQTGDRGDHDLYLSQDHPAKAIEDMEKRRAALEAQSALRSGRWPMRPPDAARKAPPAPLPPPTPLPPRRPRTEEEERQYQERVKRLDKEARRPDAAPYVWRALARQQGRYR